MKRVVVCFLFIANLAYACTTDADCKVLPGTKCFANNATFPKGRCEAPKPELSATERVLLTQILDLEDRVKALEEKARREESRRAQ